MEVDEVQCKFPRLDSVTTGHKQNMNDAGGGSVDLTAGAGRFHGWPSSRIVRVSRASGGKDRHSKVLTTKGLRDRRVRLSVNTAIQFYDLQDRLGYDQPSKAVEWLLKAAATSIIELPPMNMIFPDTPKQASGEKRSSTQLGFDSVDLSTHQQMTKSSACSSNSETNKSSGLSLSRSDSRVQERVADKKEKENELLNPISHTTSFTELLNGRAGSNGTNSNSTSPNGRGVGEFQKSPPRQWSSAPMDYFGGFFGAPPVVTRPAANPLPSVSWDDHNHHPEVQQFSIVPEHLIVPVVNAAARGNNNGSSEYKLNFKISSGSSSGLSGFPRGTLQSNSSPSSLIPNLQRFPATNGSSPPCFYIGTVENHHQFCYDAHADDNNMHSGQKRKGKN